MVVRRARSRRTTRRTVTNTIKEIKVGVLGDEPKIVTIDKTMTAKELANLRGVDEYREVKASKNGRDRFVKIDDEDEINGYKSILYIPEVSGGN